MKYPNLFFILILLTAFPISIFSSDGFIIYFEGDVSIQRGDNNLEADFGLPVFQGDILKTADNSLLIVELSSSSKLKLKGNTILALETTGKEASLFLNKGSVFAKVKKLLIGTFTIRTPSMVAGVRGTEFFVAYGRTIETEPDVWLCVNEGAVDVSLTKTGESVLVEEGKGVNILSGNKLTEPVFYPWTKRLNWNTDPDNGSVTDITNLDSAYEDLLDQDYE